MVDWDCNAAKITADFAAEVGIEVGGVKELASWPLVGYPIYISNHPGDVSKLM